MMKSKCLFKTFYSEQVDELMVQMKFTCLYETHSSVGHPLPPLHLSPAPQTPS